MARQIPYYDNKPAEPAEDGWVDVERIYCFDCDAFDETLMEALRAIFKTLPQSIKHDAHDCHWWYSDSENIEDGYLTAGVEPRVCRFSDLCRMNHSGSGIGHFWLKQPACHSVKFDCNGCCLAPVAA